MNVSPYVYPGVKVKSRDLPKEIFRLVCKHHNISTESIFQRTKKHPYLIAKQQISYILYEIVPYISYEEVALLIGGYHHTTIMNNVIAVQNAIDTEPETKELIERIMKQLK